MKKISAIIAIMFCLALPLFAFAGCWQDKYETAKPSLAEADGWKLTYSDDFSDFSTLEEVWEKTSWYPVQHGTRREGYWCDETLKLDTEEGALVVSSFRDGNTECDQCPEEGAFSGGVWTKDVFEQAFGYFEATVKVPTGSGLWSAFWLQTETVSKIGSGGEDGTEIDVYESSFQNNPTETGNALHYDAYSAPWYHYGDHVADVGYNLYDGQYHTYSVWWNPEYYVFYVDGEAVWATDYAGVSKVPEYMMLTVEINSNTYGPYGQKMGYFENRKDDGNNFYIKSVNVWQNESYEQFIQSPDEFEDMTQSYTIGAAVGGTIGGIIAIAAIALIIRAVVKKKKAKRETP